MYIFFNLLMRCCGAVGIPSDNEDGSDQASREDTQYSSQSLCQTSRIRKAEVR